MINHYHVKKKYEKRCSEPSDINELLPYLKSYSEKCNHITEMGIRNPVSTYAFLSANPKKLVSYDIHRWSNVDEVEVLAPGVFTFVLQDVLLAEIEETDFLFIDTYHTATQLEQELARHADKVRHYIGFHDTASFWEAGELPYERINSNMSCGKGLKYAIEPFLEKGEWEIAFRTEKNNGLMIIERKNRIPLTIEKTDQGPFHIQKILQLKYLVYLISRRIRRKVSNLNDRLYSIFKK